MKFFPSVSSWNSRRGDTGHPASAPGFGLLRPKESTLGEEDEKQFFQHAVHAQCSEIPVRKRSSQGKGLSLLVRKCKTSVAVFSRGASSDGANTVEVGKPPNSALVSDYTRRYD